MGAAHQQRMRRRLFRRYAWYFVAAVCVSLLANGIFGVWYAYRTQESSLVAIQREQALAAAARIEQFVAGVESHLGWTVQVPWTAESREQKLLDAQRLLRQVPAIMDLLQTDAAGIEQLHVSRVAIDAVGRGRNLAQSEAFQAARRSRAYYGPVYFRRESEPYMSLAVAGALGDAGVSIADVNLKAIWDVVSQLRVGRGGRAYVVGFVAAASHDLRQPMHALNLYLGTLAAHELPPAANAVLANARECARTMDALFRALLDMSRLDASVVPTHREDFPIADVLDLLRLEFEPQAQAKGLRLRVVRSSAVVHGDPALTGRILANLVSNAVRYTRAGRILGGCRRTAGGVRVEVHDTGPGIPAAQQEAVFEEFYQVDNPGRDRSQGLGLGLAIVRRLARLLDAPLTLRSTPGRGSCFAIELPAGKAVAPPSAPALPPSAAQVDLAGALVFVVDDEATILHATGTLLRRWGCHVALAESGAEALRLASEATRVPDALLCDYRLARHETGVEVIAQLRNEFNADIPALLVTGDTAPAQIQRVQASGLPVLHKPLQEQELRAALGALLAAARAGEV